MSVIKIDDRDPSVKYNGNWIVGVAGSGSSEYMGTVSSSTHAGDSFTVPFNGTSITVYGTLDSTSQGVVTSYSIDGARPSQLTSSSAARDTSRVKFWESPQLSSGSHTLAVTMIKVINLPDQPTEGTVWFDWFSVENVDTTTAAPQISTTTVTISVAESSTIHSKDSTTSQSKLTTLISNTTTSLPTATTGLQTSSANTTNVISTPAVSQAMNTGSDQKSSASVIVASSIAGALLLVLLISGILLWRRRRQISTALAQVEPYSTDPTSAPLSEAATPTRAKPSQIRLGTAAATSPRYTQHLNSEVRQLDVELPPTYSTLPALVNRRNGRTNKS